MAGPNLSMPSVQGWFELTRNDDGAVTDIAVSPELAALLATLQQLAFNATRAGSTSARLTSSNAVQRYVGLPYFDQTLGFPVFLKHASSNVWVDATGAPV